MLKKVLFSLILCTIALSSAMAQNTYKSHTVQRGETYESIAQLYGISVDAIKRANPNNYDLIYAGMKLVIPESTGNVVTTSEQTSQPKSTTKTDKKKQKDASTSNVYKQEPTTTYTSSTSDRSESASKSQERNQCRVLGGLTYYATDFSGFKGSSHYGITMDVLNIEGSLFGFNTTLGGLNYGFVESDWASYQCWFGPNISYEVVPNISIALPVQANVDVVFDVPDDLTNPNSKKENKVTWGWAISPRVYCHINRLSINVGIMVFGGFKSSNVSCGMTAGIGYQF